MRKIGSALAALGLFLGLGALLVGPASATESPTPTQSAVNEGVCAPGDTGKIDVDGSVKTITVTAPEGYLVSGYCVKAGSIVQGDGPEYVAVNPPQASVTFGHSTGKDISHYSATFVKKPTPTPTPTSTSPTPTPTETTATPTPTPTITTPTPTPTITPTPGPSTPTPTPTLSSPTATPPPPAPPTLADTGAPVGLAAAAATLLASGAGLLLAGRRKSGTHE